MKRIERTRTMDLKGRNFSNKDFTPRDIHQGSGSTPQREEEMEYLGVIHTHGKNIALISEKTSTRTRCASEG